jgi:hypothetical protein
MAVSFNPIALYHSSTRTFTKFHPYSNRSEAEQVVALGEPDYNKLKLRQAAAWIERNPRRSFGLVLARTFSFWFPRPSKKNPVSPVVLAISSLLSLPGVWFSWRKNRPGTQALVSVLLLFPPVYYIIQCVPRYRYPIIWVSAIFAGIALHHLAGLLYRWLRTARTEMDIKAFSN